MKHGSLFDGAGGMRRGFEQAGFETAWTVELMNGDDIRTIAGESLDRVDCISGGPPCQRVSSAAALHGKRTLVSLWPDMLRIVDAGRPPWVVVEQPKGGQPVIVQAALDLQRIGYGCCARIIDSQHWVPQRRPRWFLVGRMGISGLALWNHLYPDGLGMERGELRPGAHAKGQGEEPFGWSYQPSRVFNGPCADCLRGGIFAGISARRVALVGAGNAVSVPVAKWLAGRITEAERDILAAQVTP